MTQATLSAPTSKVSKNTYVVEHNGDYIEVKVYDHRMLIVNTYTIENRHAEYRQWCIEGGHAHQDFEPEFNPDGGSDYSVGYSDAHLKALEENLDLVFEYVKEQITKDFAI